MLIPKFSNQLISKLFTRRFSQQTLTFFGSVLDSTDKVEGRFWQVIKISIHDLVEAFDSIVDINKYPFQAGKRFSYEEWL